MRCFSTTAPGRHRQRRPTGCGGAPPPASGAEGPRASRGTTPARRCCTRRRRPASATGTPGGSLGRPSPARRRRRLGSHRRTVCQCRVIQGLGGAVMLCSCDTMVHDRAHALTVRPHVESAVGAAPLRVHASQACDHVGKRQPAVALWRAARAHFQRARHVRSLRYAQPYYKSNKDPNTVLFRRSAPWSDDIRAKLVFFGLDHHTKYIQANFIFWLGQFFGLGKFSRQEP